jgi:hypothetical protein
MINHRIMVIALLITLLPLGCTQQSAQHEFHPIMGIVAEMDVDNSSFVLTTLPQSEGLPCVKTPIEFDENAEILDIDGNVTTIMKNYDTVVIEEGNKVNERISALKIIIKNSAKATTSLISQDNTTKYKIPALETPGILLDQLKDELPVGFPASAWTALDPEEHPSLDNASILTIVNNNWRIYLISNPATEEVYSATVTESNDTVWKGNIYEDRQVVSK